MFYSRGSVSSVGHNSRCFQSGHRKFHKVHSFIVYPDCVVRKGIPNARARRGIISSGDPFKDRARTVHHLIKTFENHFDKNEKKSMANIAKDILEIGDADLLFSGKDWWVSGVAVFVYLYRRFSPYCGITYNDIRENVAHFSSGASFVSMLKTLEKRFG